MGGGFQSLIPPPLPAGGGRRPSAPLQRGAALLWGDEAPRVLPPPCQEGQSRGSHHRTLVQLSLLHPGAGIPFLHGWYSCEPTGKPEKGRLASEAFRHLLLPFPAKEPRKPGTRLLRVCEPLAGRERLLSSQEPPTETPLRHAHRARLTRTRRLCLSCLCPAKTQAHCLPEGLQAGHASASLVEVLRLTRPPLAAQAPIRVGPGFLQTAW